MPALVPPIDMRCRPSAAAPSSMCNIHPFMLKDFKQRWVQIS